MKKYLFAVVLGITTIAHAQQPAPVLKTSGTFFALSVDSMDSIVRWYQEKLGLSVAMQVARTDATKAIAFGPYAKQTDQPANAIIRDGAGNLIQIFGK